MRLRLTLLAGLCILSIAVILFISKTSIRGNRYSNNFNRLFPPRVTGLPTIFDLGRKDNYIAGADSGRVYFGDTGRPNELTIMNLSNGKLERQRVRQYDEELMVTSAMRIKILVPYFFLLDGSRPFILRGNLKDLYADTKLNDEIFFVDAQPVDSLTVAMRSLSSDTGQYMMVRVSGKHAGTTYFHTILEKQVDGLFCVDGTLHFDKHAGSLVYVYRFRNQYIYMDDSLNVRKRSNTIDTVRHAAIKVFREESTGSAYLAAPPLTVNKNSALYRHHLFVNSNLMALNEERRLFDDASVIDVYDIREGMYMFSFYLYDYRNIKLGSFAVTENYLVALYDNYVLVHKLISVSDSSGL